MIEFNSKSATHSEFSNFYQATFEPGTWLFELDGHQWSTVEHYFQAQKFPTDPTLQQKIRHALTPTSAKRLGRTKTSHFRSDWEHVKEDVMMRALRAKFTQNPDLQKLLLETGSEDLCEKNPSDSYWGMGRSGNGQNRMGVLLMMLREELRSHTHEEQSDPSPQQG